MCKDNGIRAVGAAECRRAQADHDARVAARARAQALAEVAGQRQPARTATDRAGDVLKAVGVIVVMAALSAGAAGIALHMLAMFVAVAAGTAAGGIAVLRFRRFRRDLARAGELEGAPAPGVIEASARRAVGAGPRRALAPPPARRMQL